MVSAVSVSSGHTCACSQRFTLRKRKRKLLWKLWSWSEVQRPRGGKEKDWERGGGGTGEGSQQAAPEGITRRLLIRTQTNEVQGQTLRASPFTADIWPSRTNQTSSQTHQKTGSGRSTNASNRTRSSVLLFTGARFPPAIQNRMLFEMSIQGCLQFHLAIKAKCVLAARWNIFQEGRKKIKKKQFWGHHCRKGSTGASELPELIWVLSSVEGR